MLGARGLGIGLSFSAMANLIVQNVRQEQTGGCVTCSLGVGSVGACCR